MVRLGVAHLIGLERQFEVCGEADGGADALVALDLLYEGGDVDIVVVDLSLEDINGLELIKQIRSRYPDLKVLVLSMHDEQIYAERTLRAGAQGYVMKRETASEVAVALNRIIHGDVYVSDEVASSMLGKMVGSTNDGGDVDSLTDRELEVLHHLGQGLAPRHVAEELGISVKTVEAHRESMKRKLDIGSAAELTQFAVQWAQRHATL